MNLKNAALLIIDMQYDFIGQDAVIPCSCSDNVVANINKVRKEFHNRNLPVIYTQEAHRSTMIDFGRELDGDEPVHCLEGSRGVEIIEELKPASQDYVIPKRRYSGFFQTDLKLLLDSLNIDTLIITGAATDVCVRATATDAQQYGYFVYVPKDCVAGTSLKQQEAALEHIQYILGKVVESRDIIRS
jgi:nicotinamidase-related amidase